MLDWKQIVRLGKEELARLDIAEVHLACAAGLPGTENWNYQECLRTLDDWTEKVREATQSQLYRYESSPEQYNFSEGYFRILVLITVLQRDCGVMYNLAKVPEDAVFEPDDCFIYGITHGGGGTCATMPVVYVSVGRRLGYPLRLVMAKGKKYHHLFCRWEGIEERFNIDASGRGLCCFSDNYYRSGRYEISPDLEKEGRLLVSLSRREELAGFLSDRSLRFFEKGLFRQGAEAMAWASAMAADNIFHRDTLKYWLNKWWQALETRKPPGFPELSLWAPRRRFPRTLPFDLELDIMGREAIENLLNTAKYDRFLWEPLRKGQIPARYATKALVDWDEAQKCEVRLEFSQNASYFSWSIPS
jgi:hypothetical protein